MFIPYLSLPLIWFCNKLDSYYLQLFIFMMENMFLFFILQLTQPLCNHLVLKARWSPSPEVITSRLFTFIIKPLKICSKFRNFNCCSFTTISTRFVFKLDDFVIHLQLRFFVFIKKANGASLRGWHSHCFVGAFKAIAGFQCFGLVMHVHGSL